MYLKMNAIKSPAPTPINNKFRKTSVGGVFEAWEHLSNKLATPPNEEEYTFLLQQLIVLRDSNMLEMYIDWYFEDLCQKIRITCVNKFWIELGHFQKQQKKLSRDELCNWTVMQFKEALNFVYVQILPMKNCVQSFGTLLGHIPNCFHHQNVEDRFTLTVHSLFFSPVPEYFHKLLYIYFYWHFHHFSQLGASESGEKYSKKEAADVKALSQTFSETCSMLTCLKWMKICEPVFTEMLFDHIEQRICRVQDDFTGGLILKAIKTWMQQSIHPWLELVLCRQSEYSTKSKQQFVQWKIRLEFFVCERFADMRMDSLFEIISAFPGSRNALEDLKQCLNEMNDHKLLIRTLKSMFEKRLLHPGVNTADIIALYINTVKALRLLDPSGIVLEAVSGPLNQYLRAREDSVTCVVATLFDDSCADLFCKADAMDVSSTNEILYDAGDDDDSFDDTDGGDTETWQEMLTWQPHPTGTVNIDTALSKRLSDILGLLISLSGSSDQFINEYRNLLADRLMTKCDPEKEIRMLDILKHRFGKTAFLSCDVMIKDIVASHELNRIIRQGIEEKKVDPSLRILNATVISSEFWPSIPDETIVMPQKISKILKDYNKFYKRLKDPRELTWKHSLGQVDLEFELGQPPKSVNLKVSPPYVPVIMLFQSLHKRKQRFIGLKAMAELMKMSKENALNRTMFWVRRGLVKEIRRKTKSGVSIGYALISTPEEEQHAYELLLKNDEKQKDGFHNNDAYASQQKEDDQKTYEAFILGTLTRFNAFSIERLHNTLKMCDIAVGTQANLYKILTKLVNEGKLEVVDGMYKKK